MKKVDIMAFGAHPDDVELGSAGTLIKHVDMGKSVVICDLTKGEMGTRGTPEIREAEAKKAADKMGVSERINLDLGDAFFEIEPKAIDRVVEQLRYYRPDVVLCNAREDRHPDHQRGGDLVSRACFIAGLRAHSTRWEGEEQAAWRPKSIYRYVQDRHLDADVIVDISAQWDLKMSAIQSFKSQFYNPDSKEPESPISSAQFLDSVKAHAILYGRMIGVEFGEGFTVDRTIGTTDLTSLL